MKLFGYPFIVGVIEPAAAGSIIGSDTASSNDLGCRGRGVSWVKWGTLSPYWIDIPGLDTDGGLYID